MYKHVYGRVYMTVYYILCWKVSSVEKKSENKHEPDLPFLHFHNSFTNERISVYLDKHSRMSLNT